MLLAVDNLQALANFHAKMCKIFPTASGHPSIDLGLSLHGALEFKLLEFALQTRAC